MILSPSLSLNAPSALQAAIGMLQEGKAQQENIQRITSVTIVAGSAVVKPSIDGVWQTGERNDANEYRLSSVFHNANGKGEAYVRFNHDNSTLYSLIDVPSDDGSIRPGNHSGLASIALDTNMDGLSPSDSADANVFFDILQCNHPRELLRIK